MAQEPLSDFARKIMDITVELYSDQMGEKYTWREATEEEIKNMKNAEETA